VKLEASTGDEAAHSLKYHVLINYNKKMGHQRPLLFYSFYSFDLAFAAANKYPAAFCCSFNEDINSLGGFGSFGAFGVFGSFGAFGVFGSFGVFGGFGGFDVGSEKHEPTLNLRG